MPAAGGRIFIKPETLQRTGSFKFRGAFNKISALIGGARRGGVVAFSSGNHAQGVAAAAADPRARRPTIVMPADAPAIKIANTRSYGAEVILYDRYREDREAGRGAGIGRGARARPWCGPTTIPTSSPARAPSAARSRANAKRRCGCPTIVLLSPCGGGGLIAGIALALTATVARCEDLCRRACRDSTTPRARWPPTSASATNPGKTTICDALMAPMPGELTFRLNDRLLAGGLAVTDEEVQAAMAYAFRTLKLVVEPGGAVALAAVLSGKHRSARARTAAIVFSGGNVDPAMFARRSPVSD